MEARPRTTRWSIRGNQDPALTLHFDGRDVRTEGLEPELHVTAKAWRAGDHDARVREHFGLKALVALHALADRELCADPPPRAPRLRHYWELPEDQSGWARLHGRALEVDVFGLERLKWSAPIDGLDEEAIPEEPAAALGSELLEEVMAMARRAASLACYCGAGFDQPEHHGALTTIKSASDPSIPLSNHTASYICRVCNRGWICTSIGDSHYSYDYRAEWIDPNRSRA